MVPDQPWLDGYCIGEGVIRQFVAMPLGSGNSAEEQLTGKAEHGGLQIEVFPMKRSAFEKRFPVRKGRNDFRLASNADEASYSCCESVDMGLAAGGRMKQEIYEDDYGFYDWDRQHCSRCFVHIANSMVWHQITGEMPPTVPPTAKDYTEAGLPWFDYYDDQHTTVIGSEALKKVKSITELDAMKSNVSLPENQAVDPRHIIKLRAGLKQGEVREGSF